MNLEKKMLSALFNIDSSQMPTVTWHHSDKTVERRTFPG